MNMGSKANIQPWELHVIWKICRQVHFHPDTDAITSDVRSSVTVATIEEFDFLIDAAISLDLLNRSGQTLNLTAAGKKFSLLKHWRYWKPKNLPANIDLRSSSLISKNRNRPKVIDLFSGGGGLGLGFEQAGFELVAAVENDPQACEAHRKNFPECAVFEGDINEFSQDTIRHLKEDLGVDAENIAGVIGGPPCQGFSYIGERVTGDERNLLTHRFVDVVLAILPDFFVLENVKGLLNSGKLPPLVKHLTSHGQNIGPAASEIVELLPPVPQSVAKRDRQFRKRLVSGCVDNARKQLKGDLEVKSLINFWECVVAINDILVSSMSRRIEEVYAETNYCSDALTVLTLKKTQFSLLSVGMVLEHAVQSGIIKNSLAGDFIRDCVNDKSAPVEFIGVLNDVIVDYDEAPKLSDYKGVDIGPILRHLIERLEKEYEIPAPKILNSGHYGAPQSRERVFLVGTRKKLGVTFEYPKPLYKLPGIQDKIVSSSQPEGWPCEAGLSDLPDIDQFESLRTEDKLLASHLKQPSSEYAQQMRGFKISKDDFSLPRETWDPYVLDCCLRTLHASHALERIKETDEGKEDKKSHRKRLHRAKASHTLRAGTREGKGSHTAVRPIHYEHNRVVSVREGARLMGYPDWMTFHRTKWHGFRLVGNGVPAPLGKEVATAIRNALKQSKKPN